MASVFLLLALVAIAGTILNSAWFKGVIGEYWVNSLIERELDKRSYRIFKDVLLPTEDGTTQIDHIIVSRFGIFAIETKNMSHWIFANNGPYWTQTRYKWKNKFQNPLRQNYKHVKTLENLLEEARGLVINVVVFAGDCEFKTDVEKNVVKLTGLIPFIKSFQYQVIDEDKLNIFARRIESNKLESTIANKIKHIQHVDRIMINNGHDGGILKKLFAKYIYKIVVPIAFLLILFSMLDNISKQSSKMFSDIISNNIEHQNKIKQEQQAAPQQQTQQKPSQYASRTPQQVVGADDNRIVTPKEPSKYRSAIYSWTNERGQRVSSNVGFPADKHYTDPKIEWH